MLRLAAAHLRATLPIKRRSFQIRGFQLLKRRKMALKWSDIQQRKANILNELFTIDTSTETINDHGVEFVVRIATSLSKKPLTATPNTGAVILADPFDNPPTQKLFAGPITSTHSFIFNKFNLVQDHMVIVTNEYEPQFSNLTLSDMAAVWKCLVDLGGLGFFNGGRLAGASQPHKHLQFVPIPLVPGSDYAIPMESTLLNLPSHIEPNIPFVHPGLPFYNLFATLDDTLTAESGPQQLFTIYNKFLELSAPVYEQNNVEKPWCYNLLFMKRWILFVPRLKECVDGTNISVNSMGFAGTIFVKSLENLEVVKSMGPMSVLTALALPKSPDASL